jgi:hypothetical protein
MIKDVITLQLLPPWVGGRKPFALDIKPQIKSNVPVDTVAGGAPRLDLTEQRKRRLLSAGASSLLLLPLRN